MTVTVEEPQRQRLTSTPERRQQTAAATAARRRAYAARVAMDLACRLDEVDDERVVALAAVLLAEARRRGLEVPDLDE